METRNYNRPLDQSELAGATAAADWPSGLRSGDPIALPARTVLASEGQRIGTVYLIESGVVSLDARSDDVEVLTGFRGSGTAVGAVCAVSGQRYGQTVRTLGEVRTRIVPVGAFHEARSSNLAVAIWVQKVLAREMDDQVHWFLGLSARSAKDRLRTVLADLFRKCSERRPDGSRRLLVSETVEHLAAAVRITRERASQLLAEFAQDGLLARDARGWLAAPAASPFAAFSDARSD